MEEIIEELEKERRYLKGKCIASYKCFAEARDSMITLRSVWEGFRDMYEAVDRRLAEFDGRLTVITKKKGKKEDPVVHLTLGQIKEIADKLGVKIEMETNEGISTEDQAEIRGW